MTALTWNELADLYFKATGQQARTKPMNSIFEWAENQSDKFTVDENGCLHLKESTHDFLFN